MARRRYNLDFAGQSFGFELPSVTEEDGETKTESVLADYFPEIKFSFGSKTQRGGRLGRAATQVTPELMLKQKEVATLGGGGPITVAPTFTNTFTPPPAAPAPAPVQEAPKPSRPAISTAYGVSSKYFGHEDYFRNLEAGYTPAELKEYIIKNEQLLNPESSNVRGGGGLFDQIMKGQVQVQTGLPTTPVTLKTESAPSAPPAPKFENPLQTQSFVSAPQTPQPRGEISTKYGIDPTYFGGEDVTAAKSMGYSAGEILDYIERTKAPLRGTHVRGGGGLYDQLMKEAGRA
ncbi:MAG: hypothetical protein FJ184_06740 [Gammaproteobacteria bacterium]|nr:hypothetical protein [Gammaproteobacteria bacterium]